MPRFGDGCWRPLAASLFMPQTFASKRSALAVARRLRVDYPDDAIALIRTNVRTAGELCELVHGLPLPGGEVDFAGTFPLFEARAEVS